MGKENLTVVLLLWNVNEPPFFITGLLWSLARLAFRELQGVHNRQMYPMRQALLMVEGGRLSALCQETPESDHLRGSIGSYPA